MNLTIGPDSGHSSRRVCVHRVTCGSPVDHAPLRYPTCSLWGCCCQLAPPSTQLDPSLHPGSWEQPLKEIGEHPICRKCQRPLPWCQGHWEQGEEGVHHSGPKTSTWAPRNLFPAHTASCLSSKAVLPCLCPWCPT